MAAAMLKIGFGQAYFSNGADFSMTFSKKHNNLRFTTYFCGFHSLYVAADHLYVGSDLCTWAQIACT